jgi:hypothetical protein
MEEGRPQAKRKNSTGLDSDFVTANHAKTRESDFGESIPPRIALMGMDSDPFGPDLF